jgi:hypothetical protein
MIEKKFVDDEQYGVLQKMSADLARAGRVKVETDAATFLETTGFGTATLNRTVDETLFHAAHVLASSSATYSNKMTGKLGYENLRTAIKTMKKMPNEAGAPIVAIPNMLVVPVDLEDTAKEILKTMKKPGSNENDINTIENIEILVEPYFSTTTGWFLLDTRLHQLNWFWRIRPFFDKEQDFDSLVYKWMGYMRYSFGASDWRGIIGSDGSGAADVTYFDMIKNISEKSTAIATSADTIADNTVKADPIAVAILGGNQTLVLEATLQLHALVFPASADQSIVWTSATPAVATISSTGLVTAVTAGTSVIRAASAEDATKYAEITITASVD